MASQYSVFTIEPEIIKVIHKYVFDYTYEICANLKKTDKGTLVPHNVLKGKLEEYSPGKWRGTCSHQEYSSNIIHTHPLSSYAYPSTDDIMKVIKNYGKIVNSLVGTKWGIWVVSNTTSSNIYSKSQESVLASKIKKYLDRIGFCTKTTDKERETSDDKSKVLMSEDYVLIAKTIKTLSDLLMVKIELHSWDDIMTTGLEVKGLTEYEE
ncbi:MAG: hypothetical protein PHG66_04360 [Candidatus Colwellbacteria bacterium]|nr:hypothetical protein [Candidatus Colwellbacteria bacterium]